MKKKPTLSGPVDASGEPELDLAAMKVRIAAATKGPWRAEDIGAGTVACGVVNDEEVVIEHDFVGPNDAEFIAHARQDIPVLIAEIERLRATAAVPSSPVRPWCQICGATLAHDYCDACHTALLPPSSPVADSPTEKFIRWVEGTAHGSLTGDSRVAYDAQVRILRQLRWYLEGKDDYLNALIDLSAPSPSAGDANRPDADGYDLLFGNRKKV